MWESYSCTTGKAVSAASWITALALSCTHIFCNSFKTRRVQSLEIRVLFKVRAVGPGSAV